MGAVGGRGGEALMRKGSLWRRRERRRKKRVAWFPELKADEERKEGGVMFSDSVLEEARELRGGRRKRRLRRSP